MKLYQDVLHDHVVAFGSESVADWELFKNILSNSLSLPSVQVQYKKKKKKAAPHLFVLTTISLNMLKV